MAGKFFNKWIVLATDALSFSLAFAYLIIWTILSERNDGLRDLVIILGVFLVYVFENIPERVQALKPWQA